LTATILKKRKTFGRQEGRSDNTGLANWWFSAPQISRGCWLIKVWFTALTPANRQVGGENRHLLQARKCYG